MLKARGFVYRFKIENGSVDVLADIGSDPHLRQQGHLYVFCDSGGANDAHSAFLNEGLHLVEGSQFLRQDSRSGAGVENEIKRPLDSFDGNFAAEKATRGRAHLNFNSRARFGRGGPEETHPRAWG